MNPFTQLSASTRKRRNELITHVLSEMQTAESVESLQLRKLNTVWANACADIPYYQELIKNGVPSHFESLESFSSLVPSFSGCDLQVHGNLAFSQINVERFQWSSSGGTTGSPKIFPRHRSEVAIHEASEWYLRSLVDISPDDSYFKIWGHTHMLGKGLRRQLNSYKRKIQDRGLNITRVSAYDLSSKAVLRGIHKLQNCSPKYVMGYSKALEIYATELHRLNGAARLPALKGVIATSESFSTINSRKQIEEAFNCPVFMDYGSMETGTIAQEATDGKYHVAWNYYFLEAVPADDGAQKLLITALYPRAFPLFRYDTGDLISGPDRKVGIRHFRSIDGKSYPLLTTPRGNRVHPASLIDCIKCSNSTSFFQVGLKGEQISIIYISLHPGGKPDIAVKELHQRLTKVDKGLGDAPIKVITQPLLTPAGKRPTFIQEKT